MGRNRIVTRWEYSDDWTELNRATERAQADLAEADKSVSRVLSGESVDDVDWDEIIGLARDAERQVKSAEEIVYDFQGGLLFETQPDESSAVRIEEVTTAAERVTDVRESLERAKESAARGAPDAVKRELAIAHDATEQGRDRLDEVADAATGARQPKPPSERDWIDKIKDTIPVEVLGVWGFIAALVTASPEFNNDWYWWVFAAMVVATALHAFQDIVLSDETDASGYVASLVGGTADGRNDDSANPDVADIKPRVAARWSIFTSLDPLFHPHIACSAGGVTLFCPGSQKTGHRCRLRIATSLQVSRDTQSGGGGGRVQELPGYPENWRLISVEPTSLKTPSSISAVIHSDPDTDCLLLLHRYIILCRIMFNVVPVAGVGAV